MRPATKKIARDYGGAILAAVIVALVIRFFIVEAYRIPTSAMRPTLEPGDTIFVTKSPIGFDRKPDRGDVVVYASPTEPGRDYIKRVLALPGDTIEIRKGQISLNGKPIASASNRKNASCGQEEITRQKVGAITPYIYEVCWEPPIIDDFGPEKVPEGSVFVLGDLRSIALGETRKRRSWGMIPAAALRGQAKWIWLSIEPSNPGMSPVRFPNFRLERMFRRIQ